MLELVASHGKGFKQPSYHEIRVKYLKQQVENINDNLEEHRRNWKKIGCSIMTDALTDRRRTILNFLLNSPKGIVFLKYIDASEICKTSKAIFKMMDEVVAKVREEAIFKMIGEVVEEANYKAAGDLLMHRRKNLYWTACAVHCIDLMLEEFEKKVPLQQETIASGKKITTSIYGRIALICLLQNFSKGANLIRSALTCFSTSYLTLGCLHDNKGSLIRMFTLKE